MGIIEGIAQTILDGFNRHYNVFSQFSAGAQEHFERADWKKGLEDQSARIKSYDKRVRETVRTIQERYPGTAQKEVLWPTIKREYIGLLLDHLQVECAETFYNSVACRILNRRYFNNDHIFWRPQLTAEHMEGNTPIYRSFYPGSAGLRRCLLEIVTGFSLGNPWEDLRRDIRYLERAMREHLGKSWRPQPNLQMQMLGSLFFRNKAAYIVGRMINGDEVGPMIIPILQTPGGRIFVDTILMRVRDVAVMFSFSRANFMVEMEVPAAYVSFLLSIMPAKSPVDLYTMLGLQKHAKTLFYRQLDTHLKHSGDNFIIAPGIRGMVMLVFTLPSFPFVFKVIRDKFKPPKKISREEVREKYVLVKFHDRVGRLADTLEYSDVAIPLGRIDPSLLAELKESATRNIEFEDNLLIVRHVYIERRMIPLNEYLPMASRKHRRNAIIDYGNAIRDLAAANIFPGDMMHKNFGVTRHKRVVFYDYDEICYITECNFRRIPPSRDELDDMSSEPFYSVEENDVFPETFGSFFFPDPEARDFFLKHHHDLIEPDWWKTIKETIIRGGHADVFPYPLKLCFSRRYHGMG